MNSLQRVFGSAKTAEDLVQESIERQVLENAARALESQWYESEAYRKAFKAAAKLVRGLKPG